ncbi:MAG: acetate kinase [Bacillota bacterium]|nr:acetate kinase [Bacillota bacterium]
MKILVINCGSSSLKYQLFDMDGEKVLAKGLVERIGIEGSRLKAEGNGNKELYEYEMKDHKAALGYVLDALTNEKVGAIKSLDEVSAIGHRVVHAGEKYSSSVLVTDEVMKALEECIELAPLHNPPNIIGIKAIQELMPGKPNVAVFDTAFHQTMPKEQYIYALPYEYYEKNKVRRYGFHGTSHKYVSERAAAILGKKAEDLKIITCHLGNGASVAAVDGGKSVATSMGLTPLEGLVMGTRCGNIDPQIITFIMAKYNLSMDDMNNIMNKKSGVLGISGVSSDFRDIEGAAAEGNERAQLALDIFHDKVRKYIGAYATVLGGVDAVVFTAGLGENSKTSRAEICKNLEFMGIEIDAEKNNTRGEEVIISTDDARVKVIVIPTNEELMIARDTLSLSK